MGLAALGHRWPSLPKRDAIFIRQQFIEPVDFEQQIGPEQNQSTRGHLSGFQFEDLLMHWVYWLVDRDSDIGSSTLLFGNIIRLCNNVVEPKTTWSQPEILSLEPPFPLLVPVSLITYPLYPPMFGCQPTAGMMWSNGSWAIHWRPSGDSLRGSDVLTCLLHRADLDDDSDDWN